MAATKLGEFLNSKFGLLVAGFFLTTLAGGVLSYWLNHLAWKRTTRFEVCRQEVEIRRAEQVELLRRRLDQGQAPVQAVADLTGLRVFRMWNVLRLPQSTTAWNDYMEVVERWNAELLGHQSRLRLLIGDDVARGLNAYETDRPPVQPVSMHGHFYVAHEALLALRRCSEQCDSVSEAARRALTDLDFASDAFIDATTSALAERSLRNVDFSADSVWRACAA